MDPKARHNLFGENYKTILQNSFDFLAGEARTRFAKSQWPNFSKDVLVKKGAATLQRINAGKLMNLARTKIGKGGMVLAAGIIGWNLIQHSVKNLFNPQPAIPRNYDRGYDLLKENLTDFGSPVKLAKTANKTITPYKSTVRKAINTTTKSVTNSNVALALHNNAIKHHHY